MQILQVWGPFLGHLLKATAATLPQIWLLSAKFNFPLTNHTFASLPTVPTASSVDSKALFSPKHSHMDSSIQQVAPDWTAGICPAHLTRPLQLHSKTRGGHAYSISQRHRSSPESHRLPTHPTPFSAISLLWQL